MADNKAGATTKFRYILMIGVETGGPNDDSTKYHPYTVVLKQAWTHTETVSRKQWHKTEGMTEEGVLAYRWSLVKSMLVREGMSQSASFWYFHIDPRIQQSLPLLCQHEHYDDGETLIDHFIADFQYSVVTGTPDARIAVHAIRASSCWEVSSEKLSASERSVSIISTVMVSIRCLS